MVVTNKGILLFLLYVFIPSVLSYHFLPSHLFLAGLFVIVLIGSFITYYYSRKQDVDTIEFDKLINSKDNFDDYVDSIKGNKYTSLIKEYKNNKKYIIENNSEIIIYPIVNSLSLLNIFKAIDFLNLPSFKYKRPLLKIDRTGIEYRGNKNIKWEDLIDLEYYSLSTAESNVKCLKLKSYDNKSIIIPFDYSGMPLRREDLKAKIGKFMKKNKING